MNSAWTQWLSSEQERENYITRNIMLIFLPNKSTSAWRCVVPCQDFKYNAILYNQQWINNGKFNLPWQLAPHRLQNIWYVRLIKFKIKLKLGHYLFSRNVAEAHSLFLSDGVNTVFSQTNICHWFLPRVRREMTLRGDGSCCQFQIENKMPQLSEAIKGTLTVVTVGSKKANQWYLGMIF